MIAEKFQQKYSIKKSMLLKLQLHKKQAILHWYAYIGLNGKECISENLIKILFN